MSDWISVTERLPAVWTDVILALTSKSVVVGTRIDEDLWDWADSDNEFDHEAYVTHWQPFPEPPAMQTDTDARPAGG